VSVRKFNTYRSELVCSTESGGEYGLPEKVTVVLVEDYMKLETIVRSVAWLDLGPKGFCSKNLTGLRDLAREAVAPASIKD